MGVVFTIAQSVCVSLALNEPFWVLISSRLEDALHFQPHIFSELPFSQPGSKGGLGIEQ